MSVGPGSEGATGVTLSSKRNATDLPMDEPETSRALVQEVVVYLKVLDLFNVDEIVEKEGIEHAQWELEPDEHNAENYDLEKQKEIASPLKMGTCEEVSRDDATHMVLTMLKSSWVLRESGGKIKARLVAEEIAYFRLTLDVRFFAATPSITSCRLFLTIASQF